MRLVGTQTARGSRRALLTLAGLVAAGLALVLSACGGSGSDSNSGDQKGEVVISCATCYRSPADPTLDMEAEAAEKFNKKYRGRYRIKLVRNSAAGTETLATYQRLALANDMPDVFTVESSTVRALARTGKLFDLAPAFEEDPAWRDRFQDGVFDSITTDGHVWGIPQQRDAIGIFYNRGIFRAAGIAEFPRTWDEFEDDCRKIEAIGKTCFAMDGGWITHLMWANLIGTQPGGADFLNRGIIDADYSTIPAVVRATERLKQWHTDGFVNSDSLSGEYANGANAYLSGQAAMIANGPWMIGGEIKGKDAVKGLYDETGYVGAPGWTADQPGTIVVAAIGTYASGAQDPRKQEAVVAYFKFFSDHATVLNNFQRSGAYPAVKFDPTPAEAKTLEPLTLAINKASLEVPLTYPNVAYAAPDGFRDVWRNLWPAYIKGQMDTKEFLSKLGSDSRSATG